MWCTQSTQTASSRFASSVASLSVEQSQFTDSNYFSIGRIAKPYTVLSPPRRILSMLSLDFRLSLYPPFSFPTTILQSQLLIFEFLTNNPVCPSAILPPLFPSDVGVDIETPRTVVGSNGRGLNRFKCGTAVPLLKVYKFSTFYLLPGSTPLQVVPASLD